MADDKPIQEQLSPQEIEYRNNVNKLLDDVIKNHKTYFPTFDNFIGSIQGIFIAGGEYDENKVIGIDITGNDDVRIEITKHHSKTPPLFHSIMPYEYDEESIESSYRIDSWRLRNDENLSKKFKEVADVLKEHYKSLIKEMEHERNAVRMKEDMEYKNKLKEFI